MPDARTTTWRFQYRVEMPSMRAEFTVDASLSRRDDGLEMEGSFLGVWGCNGIYLAAGRPVDRSRTADRVRETADGWEIVGSISPSGQVEYDRAWLWLSNRVEEGHEWSGEGRLGEERWTFTGRYGPVEEVTTPAGAVQARRMDFELTPTEPADPGGVYRGAIWFQEGRGPVRYEWVFGPDTDGETRVRGELVEFQSTPR